MLNLRRFNPDQLKTVTDASALAEEMVCDAYKMSARQWFEPRREIKTLADLTPDQVISGPQAPFAQVIRYQGRPGGSSLTSSAFDFYAICLQDHVILAALKDNPEISLRPFAVYVLTHELVHIVRFSLFEQLFDAPLAQRWEEEIRVHLKTVEIINNSPIARMDPVIRFYQQWHRPLDNLRNS